MLSFIICMLSGGMLCLSLNDQQPLYSIVFFTIAFLSAIIKEK